jgi:hypothetical protein
LSKFQTTALLHFSVINVNIMETSRLSNRRYNSVFMFTHVHCAQPVNAQNSTTRKKVQRESTFGDWRQSGELHPQLWINAECQGVSLKKQYASKNIALQEFSFTAIHFRQYVQLSFNGVNKLYNQPIQSHAHNKCVRQTMAQSYAVYCNAFYRAPIDTIVYRSLVNILLCSYEIGKMQSRNRTSI